MPLVNASLYPMLEALCEHEDIVKLLKGEVRLHEYDLKRYTDGKIVVQKKTEDEITSKKEGNKKTREAIKICQRTDQDMIAEVLVDRPDYRSGLLTASAESATELLHGRLCHVRRCFNLLAYQIRKRSDYLLEKENDIQRLVEYPILMHDEEQIARVRKLQYEIDKAQIRYDSVHTISEHYEEIKDAIKADNRQYKNRVVMTSELVEMTEEELKTTLKIADMARKIGSDTIHEVEDNQKENTKSARDRRDYRDETENVLSIAGQIPRGRKRPETTDERKMRKMSVPNFSRKPSVPGYVRRAEAKKKRDKKSLQYQRVIANLICVLQASDKDDMLNRIKCFHLEHAVLEERMMRRIEEIKEMQKTLAFLAKRTQSLQYTPEPQNITKREEDLALERKLAETRAKHARVEKILHEKKMLLWLIDASMKTIQIKLAKLEIPQAAPQTTKSSQNTYIATLDIVIKKALLLFSRFCKRKESISTTARKMIVNNNVFKISQLSIPREMLFVDLEPEEISIEHSELSKKFIHEEYRTREDIKLESQMLVEKSRQKKTEHHKQKHYGKAYPKV